MDYDLSPSAPGWVDFAPRSQRGLDLLGLRLPVQAIRLSLLDAVTTVAPKVRYLSFRTFIADAYRTACGPPLDSRDAFMAFALPAETAFALGNTLVGPDATNIVGTGKAGECWSPRGADCARSYAGPYIDGGECNQTEGGVRWAIATASCSRGFRTAATTAWIEWY